MTIPKQMVHKLAAHLLSTKKDAYCIEYSEVTKLKNKHLGAGKRIRCRPTATVRNVSYISAGRMLIDMDLTSEGHVIYDGTPYTHFLKESAFSCPLTTFLNYYGDAVKVDMSPVLEPVPGIVSLRSDVIKIDHKLMGEILQSYL